MILEEDVYLEHFGKKGMRWGSRKAQVKSFNQLKSRHAKNQSLNKQHSPKQKLAVAAMSVGAAFVVSKFIGGRSLSTKKMLIGGAAAGLIGKKFMDDRINKHGSKEKR